MKKGFSLVELLVVVAIIGILSVILVPNVQENLKRAKVSRTKALIGMLEVAVETYKNDFGKYPASYNPQDFYLALTADARSPYEPDAEEVKRYRQGQQFWVDDNGDDSLHQILQGAGVPAGKLTAQMEENVFIDSWGVPLYYVSHEEYNPGGRADFRRANRSNQQTNKPAAYEVMSDGTKRPYKPSSFQIISFGPDKLTITPSGNNGGIGSMLPTDKRDNDGDEYIDLQDQVRRDGNNDPGHPDRIAEDDITNFM